MAGAEKGEEMWRRVHKSKHSKDGNHAGDSQNLDFDSESAEKQGFEQLNSCCISGDKARNKWMKVVT